MDIDYLKFKLHETEKENIALKKKIEMLEKQLKEIMKGEIEWRH